MEFLTRFAIVFDDDPGISKRSRLLGTELPVWDACFQFGNHAPVFPGMCTVHNGGRQCER